MPDDERLLVAAATAHRACCGSEHDPSVGKLHGCCVVCGVEWPCETARAFIDAARSASTRAQGREQDVSDELLSDLMGVLMSAPFQFMELRRQIALIQRARAAGKGDQ